MQFQQWWLAIVGLSRVGGAIRNGVPVELRHSNWRSRSMRSTWNQPVITGLQLGLDVFFVFWSLGR
jgi:hypothetical protein